MVNSNVDADFPVGFWTGIIANTTVNECIVVFAIIPVQIDGGTEKLPELYLLKEYGTIRKGTPRGIPNT